MMNQLSFYDENTYILTKADKAFQDLDLLKLKINKLTKGYDQCIYVALKTDPICELLKCSGLNYLFVNSYDDMQKKKAVMSIEFGYSARFAFMTPLTNLIAYDAVNTPTGIIS
ncbi:MAG TPA: hypothetical protein GX005_00370 [Bacteroidales bacterium]|nr:hypothetical protein [Bacteroidales bacterium]